MTLKDLLVKIGFEVETDKLEGVEHHLHNIETLLEAFGAAEVLKGVYELSEKFGEMAEKLHLAAVSAGITTEAFQKLAYAAEQNGVSQDELGGAIARISRQLYDARQGSAEAQQIFAKAGFHADQVNSFKNGAEVLKALSDKFKGMKDPIKEMGILLPLAGRGSREMVSFMEQGSAGINKLEQSAEDLGAVLSGEQVEALVETEHALKSLLAVLRTLSASIAAEFAPSVKSAIGEFLSFYQVNKDIVQIEVKKWVWDITYAMGAVWAVVKFVTQAFLDFAKSHEVLIRRVGEFLFLGGAFVSVIFAITTALRLAKMVLEPLNILLAIFESEMFAILSPVLAAAAAIGLIIVAIHDLWQAAHGKPTWIQQIIDFLGIGKEIQAVFFGIFDVVSALIDLVMDLIHLDFSKFIKDSMGDLTALMKPLTWMVEMASKAGASAANFILPGVSNVESAAGLPSALPTPSSSVVDNSSQSGSYQVNAPITVNVPPGTDPRFVGDKVKEGVKEHLDRVHRETQRSLRPALAY